MEKGLFSLEHKVAIITGGGGVLGGGMARSLAAAGARICLVGRSEGPLIEVADTIRAAGGEALPLPADVLDRQALEEVKEQVLRQWGGIDILVNAAGGNMPGATIGPDQTIFDLQLDDFDKVTRLNLNGSVVPSLAFGRVMAVQKTGVIINISSMVVNRALTRVVGYSASKAAVENFTRWMAVEMALNIANATQDMSQLDHFNFEDAIPEISDYMAVPARWMNDRDTVSGKREQRQAQQEQQQLLQSAPALASAAKTVADMGRQ